MLGRVERQVLTVLETAASDDDWQVLVVVAAGVAKVTAEQDDGLVQQRACSFRSALQPCQQFAKELHLLQFDHSQFSQLGGILTVMGKIVPILGDAGNCGNRIEAIQCKGDKPSLIRLQCKMH